MASLALPATRTTRRTVHQIAASLVSRPSIFYATPSSSSAPSPSILVAGPSLSIALSLPLSSAAPSASPLTSRLAAAATRLIPDSLAAGLRELLPPWVLAVPKRRTTHGAKRMRASNKGLKEKQNIVACPSCGTAKLAHHLCHSCHVAFRRELHREAKEAAKAGLGGGAPVQRV